MNKKDLGSGFKGQSNKPLKPTCWMLNAFAVFFFCLAPHLSHAQGAAPAMFGVQEIVVQYAHFSDPKSSDFCGLTRENVMHSLVKTLTESGVNAISAGDAKPPMMGIARISLVPEISTAGDQSLDCTSFISLSAQTQSNVRVPPVDTLRNVTVRYWQQGALIASSQSLHAQQVDNFLQKMAAQLAQQYHIDQPKQ